MRMLRFRPIALRGEIALGLVLATSQAPAQNTEEASGAAEKSPPQEQPGVVPEEPATGAESDEETPSSETEPEAPSEALAPASPPNAASEPSETKPSVASDPLAPETYEEKPERSEPAQSESEQEKLVPRLKSEETQETEEPDRQESKLPAPIAQLERDRYRPPHIPTRQEEMPGDYVKRPLTLPRGTFLMQFGQGLVFAHATSFSALAPAFALGVTEDFEVGVDGPLRFDAGTKEWAALDPRPHLALTIYDEEITEVGIRARGVIPVTTDVDPAISAAVPVRIHTRNEGRLDIAPEFEMGVGELTRMKVFLPIAGALQFSDGVYGGLMARPHVGITSGAKTGVDGQLTLGLTHQSRDRAYVDLAMNLFMKNIATGETEFSDGAGAMLSLTFFPELY